MKYDMRIRRKEWESELEYCDYKDKLLLIMKRYKISKRKVLQTIRRNIISLNDFYIITGVFGCYKKTNAKIMKNIIADMVILKNYGLDNLDILVKIRKEYDFK